MRMVKTSGIFFLVRLRTKISLLFYLPSHLNMYVLVHLLPSHLRPNAEEIPGGVG